MKHLGRNVAGAVGGLDLNLAVTQLKMTLKDERERNKNILNLL